MIGIFNEDYAQIVPRQPEFKAVAIFNIHDAKLALHTIGLDFVLAIDESTGRITRCHSVLEAERFYNPDYSCEHISNPGVCIHNKDGVCDYNIKNIENYNKD